MENVLEQKIESMPWNVQLVLIVVACLGFTFKVHVLDQKIESMHCQSL
jgi:hypothetical protein